MHDRSREGIPIYAECGGLMYLTEKICLKKGWQGRENDESYEMCGVFPGETVMPARRVVSYVEGDSQGGRRSGTGISADTSSITRTSASLRIRIFPLLSPAGRGSGATGTGRS